MNAQRMPSISSSIWQTHADIRITTKPFCAFKGLTSSPGDAYDERATQDLGHTHEKPTHHMFFVLLEVRVNKQASGGINKRVLDVVNALVPARGQRGGSSGYLVGVTHRQPIKNFL